jgi:hypothetical protein
VSISVTPDQRIARAHRAEQAWEEFFGPMIGELKAAYSERLVEVANTELSRDKRADKITALSNAMKILAVLESGMREAIRDGDLAKQEKLKAEKIEQMSAPQRRLLNIGPF